MAQNTTTSGGLVRVVECQDSVTRPNDSNIYTAGDAISDNVTTPTAAGAFTLDFGMTNGSSLRLIDFTLHKSDSDPTAATFSLLLFDALPAVAGWEDNGACAITDAEMKTCKGVVKFAAADWTGAITGDIQTVSKTIGIVLASSSSTLYGILIASDAYTPSASEILTLTVHALQG